MFRPYLSIIKDSFRAAIASRILVIMLVLIGLLLLVIAPFKLKEQSSWKIDMGSHIEMPDSAIAHLVENRETETEVQHIWSKLPDSFKKRAQEFYDYDQKKADNAEPDMKYEGFNRIGFYNDFVEELNDLIESPEFFNAEVWPTDELIDPEARSLSEFGVDRLSQEQLRRLNRLIITESFGGKIKSPKKSSAEFGYLIWDWTTIEGGRIVFHEQLASWLPYILDKFVLSLGMLISILVTANIMPSVFEHGSLSLLLSKPITRGGLFLSKFFGACAFALLLSVFLFVGLWLVLGFRIGYWDKSLLYSIPIYVFVFAIYYSISAFLGMYFRNPIIAIIGTILFWVICFACGETYKSVDKYMFMCDAVDLVNQDEAVLHTDRMGIPYFWDESSSSWNQALIKEDSYDQINSVKLQLMFPFIPKVPFPQEFPPAYVNEYDAWVGIDKNFMDFQKLNPKMTVGKTNQQAAPQILMGVPSNPVKFLQHPDGGMIAASGRGEFYRLNQNPLTAKPPKPDPKGKDDETKTGTDSKDVAKVKENDKSKDNPKKQNQKIPDLFKKIGPDRPINIRDHRFVDINQTTGEIAVYRSRSIFIFKQDENGQYKLDRTVESDLDIDSSMTAWIKYQGDKVFLCLGNGKIITMDGAKLRHQNEYLPETKSAIFAVSASPNGRYLAVTYRNGNVWLLDRDNDEKMQKARVSGQGNLKAAVFVPDGKLVVSDKTARLSWYDVESWEQTQRLAPKITGIQKFYYWGIKPLYEIFPKPGEFYKLVSHLASSRETENRPDLDLTTTTEPENPWQPFRSGLVFIIVMLGLSCVVFHYTDY